MKKLLLISASFTTLIGPAMAADLARPVYRRPVIVAAPIYSWTGFYVGGNIGYSWGNARTDVAGSGTSILFPNVNEPSLGFPSTVGFADSNTARLNGVIGGGQLGYNYQVSPKWLLGFEADIQGSGERGSNTFIDPLSTIICEGANAQRGCFLRAPVRGTALTAYEAKIGWFGSVRGRLGVLLTDQFLLYGTGGLAYGQVSVSGNANVRVSTVSGEIPGIVYTGAPVLSESKTNVGFAVGGGIESKLWANWTWKLEYLYLNLGSLDATTTLAALSSLAANTPLTGPITTHTHFTDNIVRVGLNYKFGNYYAPVVTK